MDAKNDAEEGGSNGWLATVKGGGGGGFGGGGDYGLHDYMVAWQRRRRTNCRGHST